VETVTDRHPASGRYVAASPQLPTHQDELMSAHEGRPTVAEQNVTHGAGIPAVDKGCEDPSAH
jgi:hypothetical protein